MNRFLHRVYADYLMPSRLSDYEGLLVSAKNAGYAQTSIRSFFRGVKTNRVLVHRHDIDSDVRTARKMFALECRHDVNASYYFRLQTLDFGFMREIEAAGSEASYHYEEIADFAKVHKLRDPREIRRHFPALRDRFALNVARISTTLGTPLVTVASHGDFANRKLNMINHELLADKQLRKRCGIECETYDETLLNQFDMYISDRKYPVYYKPISPVAALGQYRRICLLTHPVQWETNWIDTTRCNLRRLYEEFRWHI
jgi:hypothetical protein